MRPRNLIRLPCLLLRVPLFALGFALCWTGEKVQQLASLIPGLERPL